MKKKILGVMTVVAVAAVTSYNVHMSQSNAQLSDLALSNIDALANPEIETGTICMATCINCWCFYPPCCGQTNNGYWAEGRTM